MSRFRSGVLKFDLKVLITAIGMIFLLSCGTPKKKPGDAPDSSTVTTENADSNSFTGDSDSNRAGGLSTIRFGYDSFSLSTSARSALRSNADILKQNPKVNIQVEGHCDERGGIQYNLALGEKRANSVRKYLIDLGVSGSRIETISFGKERPIDESSNEAAWSRNRRANFVITSR